MKKAKIKTSTYEVGNGFLVDIVVTESEHEAWIYHKDYGIKSMMWGGLNSSETIEDFKALVEANVPEYAEDYMSEYMDD